MADQEVALQVKTPNVPAVPVFDAATPLAQAQQIQAGQTSLQAGQTNLQMLNRQNAGQDISFRNQLISNAAAHALDADSWDAGMRAAAQQGAPEAAQYIGRYTPLLQQRLFGAYAGAPAQGAAGGAAGGVASGTTGASTPTDQLDRMYQNVTPQQMAQSVQKNSMILGVLSTVRDQQSQDAAVARLTAAGIPAQQFFGPTYNPLNIIKLYNDTQQRLGYLQNRVAGSTTGSPNPAVKTDMQVIGDVGYNPYTGQPATPQKWATTETTDIFGQKHPIAYNPMNPTQSISIRPQQPTAASASPFAAFAKTMNGAENATGNPAATNPRSSATGNGQFIDQTWLDTIKSARPDLVKGMSNQQILAMRSDPALSQEMTEAYAHNNAVQLSSDGLPVTSASLALAHRFGPDGAKTILNASPNAMLSDILPKKVIDANPQLANVTAGQYAQSMTRQFGNTPMNAIRTPTLENFDSANVDPNQVGWDYARQYPIEVQDAAKAYMTGGVMPTGNARNIGISTVAKTVAQKVATDLGRPELADDTLYPQRRQMQVDLAKTTSPQAVGGQITFGGTALDHLAKYSGALANLGNWTVGITSAGHIANWIRSEGPQQSGKINTASGEAQHYGQEISKFYAGGPAGEAERSRFLNANAALNPTTATPEELAGMVRGERDLIPGRFAQIKTNIENVLGPAAAAKAMARMDVQGFMDKINHNIARLDPSGPEALALRGNTPAAAPNAAAAPSAFVVGTTYRDNGSGALARYDGPGRWTPMPAAAPAAPSPGAS